MFCLLN